MQDALSKKNRCGENGNGKKICCGKCKASVDPAEAKPAIFLKEKTHFCRACAPDGCNEVCVPVPGGFGGGTINKFYEITPNG